MHRPPTEVGDRRDSTYQRLRLPTRARLPESRGLTSPGMTGWDAAVPSRPPTGLDTGSRFGLYSAHF